MKRFRSKTLKMAAKNFSKILMAPKKIKKYKNNPSNKIDFKKKIDELRLSINQIDQEILNRLNHRLALANQIGKLKRQNEMPIHDRGPSGR